jgi:hypothetical protein
MKRIAITSFAALACLLGCSEDPVEPPCDIEESECQKAIFKATARARGQSGAELPPIRVIERAQYRAELEAYFEQLEPDPEVSAIEAGYALLGVLPRDMGAADEAFLDDLVENVAAYYSPGNADITIIADPGDSQEDRSYTLSHEFVHALQHQRGDLGRPAGAPRDTDARVAFDSLIEGEAMWLSTLFIADALGGEVDPSRIELFFDNVRDELLLTVAESDAPLYIAGEVLPYPLGGRGVFHAFQSDGLAGIEALHADEPDTVAYWLADAEPPPAVLSCDVPEAPAGLQVIDRDRLGVVGLVAIEASLGMTPTLERSESWRDDRVVVYASDDLSQVALAYRLRLATAAAAAELQAMLLANESLALTFVQSEDELLVLAANGVEGFDLEACPTLGPPTVADPAALVRAARRLPFIR